MYSKFKQDLLIGEYYEKLCQKLIIKLFNVKIISECKNYKYDFLCDNNLKYECKADIMSNLTTFEVFSNMITKKTNLDKEIGNVLVNQKVISGLGNYLRADVLWLSKISPFRKVKDLSESDLQKIFHNSKLLTWGEYDRKEAIKQHIISDSDKIPADYKRNFFVYMQKEDINGRVVKTDTLFEGSQKRTIHWVPEVQQ